MVDGWSSLLVRRWVSGVVSCRWFLLRDCRWCSSVIEFMFCMSLFFSKKMFYMCLSFDFDSSMVEFFSSPEFWSEKMNEIGVGDCIFFFALCVLCFMYFGMAGDW